jgi:hypothetical protein
VVGIGVGTARDRGRLTSRIFICYRRDDTATEAVLIRDRLTARLGPIVEMDLRIDPGVDWKTWIEDRLATCDVALVLIGQGWLTLRGADGHPLGDLDDQLTHEISSALRRDDITVIPVLVQKARMPAQAELPDLLQPIHRQHAVEVSLQDLEGHPERLIAAVERVLKGKVRPDEKWRRWWILGAAAVAVIVVGALAGWLATRDDNGPEPIPDPMVVSPGSIMFNEQQVGTVSDYEPVAVVNDSSEALTIQAIKVLPEDEDFELDNDDCVQSNPLPAASSCTVRVAFRPKAEGERDGRLVALQRGSTRAQIVDLSGQATAAATPPEQQAPVTTGTAAVTTIAPTDTELSTLTEGPATTAVP